MKTPCGQTARSVVAACCSIAPHAPSAHSPCHKPCAAGRGAPPDTQPRSHCNTALDDTRRGYAPRVGDNSPDYGRQHSTRPLDECHDIGRSRPTAYSRFFAQMTIIHPTPALVMLVPEPAFRLRVGVRWLFFYPFADRVSCHTERASEASQAGAFLIGMEDCLALFRGVAIRLRVLSAVAMAIVAVVALLPVAGHPITGNPRTLAMSASKGRCYHDANIANSPLHDPLPLVIT